MIPADKEELRKRLVNIIALRAEAKGTSFGEELLKMKKELQQKKQSHPENLQK